MMRITVQLVLAMYGSDISSSAGELLYSVASILRGGRTASKQILIVNHCQNSSSVSYLLFFTRYDMRLDFQSLQLSVTILQLELVTNTEFSSPALALPGYLTSLYTIHLSPAHGRQVVACCLCFCCTELSASKRKNNKEEIFQKNF